MGGQLTKNRGAKRDRISDAMDAGAGSSVKARRILDAARELLLRRGSRGVTISEVARLAHVGKGTAYLYWDTKEDLIRELFVRDFLAVLDEVIATLKAAPDEIIPHRLFPLMQRSLRKHPFLTAIRMRDPEMLGLIDGQLPIQTLIDGTGLGKFLPELLSVLRDYGIVRTDLSLDAQTCATAAILEGFFSLSTPYSWATPGPAPIADTDAVLGDVIKRVIESREPIGPEAIALASANISGRIQTLRAMAAATIGAKAAVERETA